jgi:stage II sporulation protein D
VASETALRVAAEGAAAVPRERMVRVALATALQMAPLSATAAWEVAEQGGARVLVRGTGGEPWRVEQQGGLLRVVGAGGDRTPWRPGPFVARPTAVGALVQYAGRRYRGELWILPLASGLTVVNRLPMEGYLRGVVPLELGTRAASDRAALEAQAIAARSFATVRVPRDEARLSARGWHLRAGVADQAYGGVEAEYPLADAAVAATAGLVLRYNGRVVTAPYSAACGGRTAAPGEAWDDAPDAPFLRPVDDHDPSTGRAWCDIAPESHWIQELDATVLSEAVRRVLAREAPEGSAEDPATVAWVPVRAVRVASRGRSGRIGTLLMSTDRGEVPVRAAALRGWLRGRRGGALASTYFAVDHATHDGGQVASLRLRGVGHGHGVGMCQWGAIGRARAGQDARTILQHYYPGTVVGPAD